jgi:hypothetical protein
MYFFFRIFLQCVAGLGVRFGYLWYLYCAILFMVIIVTLFVTEYTNFIIIQETVPLWCITHYSPCIVTHGHNSHWVAGCLVVPVGTKVKCPIISYS